MHEPLSCSRYLGIDKMLMPRARGDRNPPLYSSYQWIWCRNVVLSRLSIIKNILLGHGQVKCIANEKQQAEDGGFPVDGYIDSDWKTTLLNFPASSGWILGEMNLSQPIVIKCLYIDQKKLLQIDWSEEFCPLSSEFRGEEPSVQPTKVITK